MKTLFTALAEELSAGRGAVVATGGARRGSTPRGPGARMLVRADGSALGTVGLTMGVTPGLGVPGQLLVAGMMFLGRVGILSFSLAFLAQRRRDNKLRYPETNILVG